MATITFNDKAPAGESVHFTLGNEDFDLAAGKSLDTANPDVVRDARVHPWLSVEEDAEVVAAVAPADQNDPHVNPSADHLSEWASADVKVAAEKADDAIQAANLGFVSDERAPEAPVAEPVKAAPSSDNGDSKKIASTPNGASN